MTLQEFRKVADKINNILESDCDDIDHEIAVLGLVLGTLLADPAQFERMESWVSNLYEFVALTRAGKL
jgi:hypothetical protein